MSMYEIDSELLAELEDAVFQAANHGPLTFAEVVEELTRHARTLHSVDPRIVFLGSREAAVRSVESLGDGSLEALGRVFRSVEPVPQPRSVSLGEDLDQ